MNQNQSEYICSLCGKEVDSLKALVFHHTDYLFGYGLLVCKACHAKIHRSHEYTEYLPRHKPCKDCPTWQREGCSFLDDISDGCNNTNVRRMAQADR